MSLMFPRSSIVSMIYVSDIVVQKVKNFFVDSTLSINTNLIRTDLLKNYMMKQLGIFKSLLIKYNDFLKKQQDMKHFIKGAIL